MLCRQIDSRTTTSFVSFVSIGLGLDDLSVRPGETLSYFVKVSSGDFSVTCSSCNFPFAPGNFTGHTVFVMQPQFRTNRLL